jgi:hypothetical protein
MGIVYNYLAITPDLLEKAQLDRVIAEALIHREYDAPELAGVLARTHIDKAWDGIAYLLSEERRATDDLYLPSDLLAQAVLGSEETLGYGWFEEGREPLILSPKEVGAITAALAPVKLGHLRAYYDVDAMTKADVYSAGVVLDYFLDYFAQLKSFYADAANAGATVLIYMS